MCIECEWGNLTEELFGRTRHIRDNDIQIDLQERGWIILAEDRDKWWPIVSTVMNICVLKNVRNSLTKYSAACSQSDAYCPKSSLSTHNQIYYSIMVGGANSTNMMTQVM